MLRALVSVVLVAPASLPSGSLKLDRGSSSMTLTSAGTSSVDMKKSSRLYFTSFSLLNHVYKDGVMTKIIIQHAVELPRFGKSRLKTYSQCVHVHNNVWRYAKMI